MSEGEPGETNDGTGRACAVSGAGTAVGLGTAISIERAQQLQRTHVAAHPPSSRPLDSSIEHGSGTTRSISPLVLIDIAATNRTSANRLTPSL